MDFLNYLLNDFLALSFWLLVGCGISTLLHFFVPQNIINKHLSSNNLNSITKASLIGIPLPLCSCSVVPTVIGLKNKGVNKASNMSFLISTPQTGIDSILITVAFFGWAFAFYKLAIALVLGIIGGLICISLINKKTEQTSTDEEKAKLENFTFKKAYSYFINESLFMIWKWLLIGLLLASTIQSFIPPNFMQSIDWANSFLGVLLVLLFSLFTYICATGSVPLAAALVSTGFPTEAAIVLLIAGPATNISTLTIIIKHFGKAFTGIYLAVVILGTLSFAYLLAGQFTVFNHEHHHAHEHLSRPIHEWIAAIFLIAYMFYFAFKELKNIFQKREAKELRQFSFSIEGVTCNGCVNKIRTALQKLDEAITVEMNFETGEMTLSLPKNFAIKEAIDEITNLNFKVTSEASELQKKTCCNSSCSN